MMAGMPEAAALSVAHLSKTYGEVEAVHDLSFSIHRGEIVGLLGPNGAGKTSILECIAGLRRPDHGDVRIGGIDARTKRRCANRELGVVLQATGLQDQITPREALRLFAALQGARPDLDSLLHRFGLAGKADARFVTLSGGQKQRLALALAFVHDPAVLVLDEPTVGLDPVMRAELHDDIRAMRREGRAVLLATHDMPEAEELCDRLLVIDRGQLVAEGSPQDLIGASLQRAILEVRTSQPPAIEESFGSHLTLLSASGQDLRFEAPDLTRGLADLLAWTGRQDLRIADIKVGRPTLTDVVVQLTGR